MAARPEYGPALQSHIRPLITGVGPIEAALATGVALQTLSDRDCLPDLAVALGSAGSRRLEQGEIFQVCSVSWRDMDASALGFTKGVTPFLDHEAEIGLPLLFDDMPSARLSTGGNVVSGVAYDAIDTDMVDMETFAVLRACQVFGVPLVGFRGISDGADELRHYDDWTALLHVLDERLARLVARIGASDLQRVVPR